MDGLRYGWTASPVIPLNSRTRDVAETPTRISVGVSATSLHVRL